MSEYRYVWSFIVKIFNNTLLPKKDIALIAAIGLLVFLGYKNIQWSDFENILASIKEFLYVMLVGVEIFLVNLLEGFLSLFDSIIWTEFATVFGGFAGGSAGLLAVTLWLKDRHRQNNPFKLDQASYYEEYGDNKKPMLRIVLTNHLNRTLDVGRVALMEALKYRVEMTNGETQFKSTRTYCNWDNHKIKNDSSEIKFNETLTIDFYFSFEADESKEAMKVIGRVKSIMIITKSGEWYVPLNSIKNQRIELGEQDYSDFAYTVIGRFLMYANHLAWKHCPNNWLKRKLFRGVW